ncbi:MAG: hypothetical protein ACRC62_23340 [Microcoleus sp.]
MDSKRIENCLNKLESWFNQELSNDLRITFVKFCLDNFEGIAQIEKAVELVIAHETNYGRFPNLNRMVELFRDYQRTKVGVYQAPVDREKVLQRGMEREEVAYSCLCCEDGGLLSNFTLERYLNVHNTLKLDAYSCGRCFASPIDPKFTKQVSQADSNEIHQYELDRRRDISRQANVSRLEAKIKVAEFLNRPDFRHEAIKEAEALNIPLQMIGVLEVGRVAA